MDALTCADGGTLLVDLTRGFISLVDLERFESTLTYNFRDGRSAVVRPSSLNWMASKSKCNFYAVAFLISDGNRWGLKLHRLLSECPGDMVTDHVDHDTMNNRISNLRICSPIENRRNSRKLKSATSAFKGVKRNACGRFVATINRRYIGTFDSEVDAAIAYDTAAIELHGEFASLNFPNEQLTTTH